LPFELLEREGFLEFRMYGIVSGSQPPEDAEISRFASVGKVLVDTQGVETVTADIMWMASVVQHAFSYGPFRAAVLAGDDIVFGTLRQVSSYRGETPAGSDIEFFRKREEALSWLLQRVS
jgi:hypothetical protein